MNKRITLHDLLVCMPFGPEKDAFRKASRESAIAKLKALPTWKKINLTASFMEAVNSVNDAAFTYDKATDSFEIDAPFLIEYIHAHHLGGGLYFFPK